MISPMLLLATLLLFLGVDAKFQDVRHVHLKFTPDAVEIIRSVLYENRFVEFEHIHSLKKRHPGADLTKKKRPVHVFYHDRNGKPQHTHTLSDPTLQHGDWLGPDGKLTGALTQQPEGYLAVTVPHDATHIEVRREGQVAKTVNRRPTPSFQHKISIPREPHFVSHPKFAALQTAEAPGAAGPGELVQDADLTQQVGPPDRHKNFIFLPCGFQSFEKSKYLAAVKNAVSFMREGSGTLVSSPWDRYIDLINFWAVWQPSVESGASYPAAPDGTGGHPELGVLERQTNLNCRYGTTQIRLLNSDYQLMNALAYSVVPVNPETTTLVTLVNDVTHGGSGGWRACSLYIGEWIACDPANRPPTGSSCVVVTADDGNGPATVGWEPTTDSALRTFIHEIGHADTDLADEYSYGVAEEQAIPLLNCAATDIDVPWKKWIIGTGTSQLNNRLGVLAPVPVCSYTNYFKPTNGLCLMDTSIANEYCAVCAESIIRAIYRETVSLAAPRCPSQDEIMVITTRNERHSIGLPVRFIGGPVLNPAARLAGAHQNAGSHPAAADGVLKLRVDEGAILTKWEFPTELGLPPLEGGIADAAQQAQIAINGAQLGKPGNYQFLLTITDNSEFVNREGLTDDDPLKTNMTFRTNFRVKVVAEDDPDWSWCTQTRLGELATSMTPEAIGLNATLNKCTFPLEHATTSLYCSICDPDKICNASYPLSPVQAEANLEAGLQRVENVIFGVGGALILGGFILLIVIIFAAAKYFGNNVKTIVRMPCILRAGRIIMLVASVILMLIAVTVIGVGTYMYRNLSAFGKAFVLVAILFAALLYLFAFLGFLAAYYRSKLMLTVNGIALFLLVSILIAMSASIFYLGNNVHSSSLKDRLRKSWVNQVSTNPKSVCTFETTFSCSGFTESCSTTTAGNSECPRNCDLTHRETQNACYTTFVVEIQDHFKPGGAAALAVSMILFLGMVINWALCCCVQQRKLTLQVRLNDKPDGWANSEEAEIVKLRAANILRNLTAMERSQLKDEFKRFDRDGNGVLSAYEMRLFYKQALEQDLGQDDVNEAIRRLDADGDGKIDFNEFVSMWTNETQESKQKLDAITDQKLAHLPKPEVDRLYKEFCKMDKDGSGIISLAELKLFYKKLFGQEPDPMDLEKALKAFDRDASGGINFVEFAEMFVGKTSNSGIHKPYSQVKQ